MADMKVLVFNCRKVLEINCRKLLDFTCFLQIGGFVILPMDKTAHIPCIQGVLAGYLKEKTVLFKAVDTDTVSCRGSCKQFCKS